MSEQRFAWIDHRIWGLEQRLSKAEYQIRQLTGRAADEVKAVAPAKPEPPSASVEPPRQLPPVSRVEDRRKVELPVTPPPVVEPPFTVLVPPPPKPDRPDTEYLIGAKLLPRVGAAMVILAVLFFVVWGFSSGWITSKMVFSGEIVFSLAFIVLGLFKRNEKEEFGQILTGIGSCGLYLTFAGGHVYYGLYSGEVLVAQFMALSLANLAYSLWLSSKSFLAIGLLGGLIAAVLPVKEHNYVLNSILHFSILLPAAYIAAKNRWSCSGLCMWLASTLALSPLLLSSSVWSAKIAALYGATMLCLAVTAREEEAGAAVPVLWSLSFVTAFMGMGLMHQSEGALHLSVLGALVLALAAVSEGRMRTALTQIGVAIPMLLAPMCFTPQQSTIIFSVLALICSLVPVRSLVWLGVVQLGLALGAYLTAALNQQIGAQPEMLLIGALTVAAIGLTRALVKLEGKAETYVMSCVGLLLPLWPRFLQLAVADRLQVITVELAITLGLLAFTWFMTGLAWKTKWHSANVAQWLAGGIALISYANMCLNAPAGAMADVTVLIALMASCIAIARTTFRINGEQDLQELVLVAIATLGCLFIRLFWVVVHAWPISVGPSLVVTIALVVLTLLTTALAVRTKWIAASGMAALWLVLSVAMYMIMVDSEPASRAAESALILGLMVGGAAVALLEWTRRGSAHQDYVEAGFSFFAGVLALRLYGIATATTHWPISLTLAGSAYAGLLALLYGVRRQRSVLAPAWIFLAFGASQYVYALERSLPVSADFGLVSGILAVFVALCGLSWKAVKDTSSYWVAVSCVGWIVFSRWFGLGAQTLQLDVHWSGALTMGWIVYAFGLLFLGLGFRVRELRYVSFAVLAATSAKVLLVDLASSPPAVRVVVLLGLGLTMLGGGYWYVRGKARLLG